MVRGVGVAGHAAVFRFEADGAAVWAGVAVLIFAAVVEKADAAVAAARR